MAAVPEEECRGQRRRRKGLRRPRPVTRTGSTSGPWVAFLFLLSAIKGGPSAKAFAPSQLSNSPQFLPALFPFSASSAATSSSSLGMVQTFAGKGLSKYFQAILSRNGDRQRFVTGKYPVIVSVEENPTKRWLNKDRATSMLLVNETTVDKSLASYDRFQWLDDSERQELHDRYASLSLELLAEIHMPKPGYVQIMSSLGAGASAEVAQELGSTTRWNRWQNSSLYEGIIMDELLSQQHEGEIEIESDETNADGTTSLASQPFRRDRLWVSGFSLAGRKGIIKSMDVPTGRIESVNARSESMTLWPNEINAIPKQLVAPTFPKHTKAPIEYHYQQQEQPHDSIQGTTETKHSIKVVKKQALGKAGVDSTKNRWDDALLVSDGFLVPGKDQGGIYVVRNPGNPISEWTVSLTDREGPTSWFYHRAVWVDLTGDGRTSILTARAKLRKVAGKAGTLEETRPKNGELVWLEMPKPDHYDEATGTPLEEDGTEFDPFSSRHLPWKERVLVRGPDVMFNVVDMDPSDDTIEIISSQFFDKKVTLHSIKRGLKPRVSFARIIDDRCGSAFGGILADLSGINTQAQYAKHQGTSDARPCIIDSGSTVQSLNPGDSFSHVLVTSHECNYVESKDGISSTISITDSEVPLGSSSSTVTDQHHSQHQSSTELQLDGGSLFAYKVPKGQDAWKTQPWLRTTVATGFKVNGGLWNAINPGAPGFVYTFHAKLEDQRTGKRPMIAVAGDCAESAYIFRPEKRITSTNGYSLLPTENEINKHSTISPLMAADADAKYKLMCEIKCGATVGSIGVGYDNLCSVEQESGYAKLYIPCYEKDKILVFAMGSGEDDIHDQDDSGWYEAEPRLFAV